MYLCSTVSTVHISDWISVIVMVWSLGLTPNIPGMFSRPLGNIEITQTECCWVYLLHEMFIKSHSGFYWICRAGWVCLLLVWLRTTCREGLITSPVAETWAQRCENWKLPWPDHRVLPACSNMTLFPLQSVCACVEGCQQDRQPTAP